MLVHLNWKSISFRYINFVRDSVCEDVISKDYDATLIEESNKVDLHGMRRTMGGGWWVGVKNNLSILNPLGTWYTFEMLKFLIVVEH